jgi:AcrR family transcriptional regulator
VNRDSSSRQRRDLSRGEIVAVADRIMRDEGESAVSMRRVAQDCGVTAMAIYHHIGSKEELLTLVVDGVIGSAVERAAVSDDWREAMVSFALAFRNGLLANPGAAAVFLKRPVVSPNLSMVTERIFAILEQGGVVGQAAAEAADAIVLLTTGSISNDLTRPPEVRRGLLELLPSETTPRLARRIEDYAVRDGEQRFELALGWLLDGIENA